VGRKTKKEEFVGDDGTGGRGGGRKNCPLDAQRGVKQYFKKQPGPQGAASQLVRSAVLFPILGVWKGRRKKKKRVRASNKGASY